MIRIRTTLTSDTPHLRPPVGVNVLPNAANHIYSYEVTR